MGIENNNNVKPNKINIIGYNISYTNIINDGFELLNFNNNVTRLSIDGPGYREWTITSEDIKNNIFSETYSIKWEWKIYWGTSDNQTLTESEILLLENNDLYSTFKNEYDFNNNKYKYICIADYYGGPINFVDKITGIGVAMFGNYSNNENSYSYDIVETTNNFGETTNYRVYRTTHKITDNLTIIIY